MKQKKPKKTRSNPNSRIHLDGLSDPNHQPFNRVWLDEKLKNLDMSQRDLARKLDVYPSALTLMIQGKRRMSAREAQEMALLFGVPLSEVFAQKGLIADSGAKNKEMRGSSFSTLSISGWVDLDGRVIMSPPKTSSTAANEAPWSPILGTLDVGILRYQTVRSQNLSLRALDGTLAYFEKGEGVDRKKGTDVDVGALGRFAVVRVSEGSKATASKATKTDDWRIGILSRGYGEGTFNLAHPDGEMIFESQVLDFARAVVWLKM